MWGATEEVMRRGRRLEDQKPVVKHLHQSHWVPLMWTLV